MRSFLIRCYPARWRARYGDEFEALLEERPLNKRSADVVTPERARHYLANLSKLWEDTEPEGRRAIAGAAFDRIDAMGIDLVLHPSSEAERYGWADAFGTDPLLCTISRYGRGERSRGFTIHVNVRVEPRVLHQPIARLA